MELDDLKYQLRNRLATDHTGRSAEDIASLLTGKTLSITAKLQKSLRFEIISCLVAIAIFLGLSITSALHTFRLYFFVFTIVLIALLFVLIWLLQRTKKMAATLPVKNTVRAYIVLIEEFMRRYFQFNMALVPICFVFAIAIGYHEKTSVDTLPGHPNNKWFHSPWQLAAFLLAYGGVIATLVFYFTKWDLKKRYGRYVEQLKSCVEELEE